jgi:hypothetical protein
MLVSDAVQCGDVNQAEALFMRSTNKVLPMYGAMMKGNNHFYIFKCVLSKSSFRLCA